MIQVSWQGRMTTSLPSTDSEVARWVAHDRPEMVRAQTADGTAYRPDAAQVLAFMQAQAHLAQMLRQQIEQGKFRAGQIQRHIIKAGLLTTGIETQAVHFQRR